MPRSKKVPTKTKAEIDLAAEVTKLTKQVQKLQNTELLKVYKHPGKFLWFSFLKGVAVGLGSVLGASVVVGLLIYILSQISFVPIVGDFVHDIIGELETYQSEAQ